MLLRPLKRLQLLLNNQRAIIKIKPPPFTMQIIVIFPAVPSMISVPVIFQERDPLLVVFEF
jgi:hypothetical protein